jgi:hypothetical protein
MAGGESHTKELVRAFEGFVNNWTTPLSLNRIEIDPTNNHPGALGPRGRRDFIDHILVGIAIGHEDHLLAIRNLGPVFNIVPNALGSISCTHHLLLDEYA